MLPKLKVLPTKVLCVVKVENTHVLVGNIITLTNYVLFVLINVS